MERKTFHKPKESNSITVEQLRQYEGLASLSDEQAKQIIESLDQLSKILFAYWQKKRDSSS